MNLFKRCACPPSARCAHPFWVRFRIHGQEYRRSTKTANRVQAQRIATVRQAAVLEGREGLRKTRTIKLSEHIKHYTAHTAKANRTSYKDAAVLARLLEEVGDRRLGDVSPFHIEKWKGARAKVVGASTVNRELNIVRAASPVPSIGNGSSSLNPRPNRTPACPHRLSGKVLRRERREPPNLRQTERELDAAHRSLLIHRPEPA